MEDNNTCRRKAHANVSSRNLGCVCVQNNVTIRMVEFRCLIKKDGGPRITPGNRESTEVRYHFQGRASFGRERGGITKPERSNRARVYVNDESFALG